MTTIPSSFDQVVAIVVTHGPDLSLFLPSIETVQAQTHAVIVVDNASWNQSELARQFESKSPEIPFISLPKHFGIGYALNFGIGKARAQGPSYSWLLTLDQETVRYRNAVDVVLFRLESADHALRSQCGVIVMRSDPQFDSSRLGALFGLDPQLVDLENGLREVKHLI